MNAGTTEAVTTFTRVTPMTTKSRSARSLVVVALAGVAAFALSVPAPAATSTTKKASTTTKKKSSSTVAATSTSTPAGAAGLPTTTVKTASAASSTVPAKTVKGTVFIPGAGRVLDLGAAEVAKLAAGGKVEADVRGASGLAASGTGTVIVDVSVANPSTPGKVTLTPVAPEFARAVVSTSVAFAAGATTVSRIAVPVGSGGLVKVATTTGPAGLAVSVVGWIVTTATAAPEPSAIQLETCRVLDTVSGLGGLQGEVTPARPFDLPAVGIAKVPAALGAAIPPTGVVLAVGSTQANGPLDITVLPSGGQSPVLTISMAPGQSTTGQFVVPVGTDARAAFYVSAGGAQITVDAVAWLDKDGVAHSGGPC